MMNDLQMLIAALVGGVFGGLLMMLSTALVVFIFNLMERKEKK